MTATRYDLLAYESGARSTSHPDRLALQARLFGLDPPAVETARVLELGCSDASNLLPMALELPRASFVGVDLANDPIERGMRAARGLGVPNIDLYRADVRDLPDEVGTEFDYVIAHGLYSWIPADAREALMATCARVLSPGGVAFVSYNAYPGSHVRDAVREIVAYAVGGTDDPEVRVGAARQVLELLANSGNPDPLGQALASYAAQLLSRPTWLLYHDELAPICDSFYLHEFVAHAERHGLSYLFESQLSHGVLRGLSTTTAQALSTLPDVHVVREQFLDFVVNRLFRESLLCRGPLDAARVVDPAALDDLRVAGRLTDITVEDRRVAAALDQIRAAWPQNVPIAELADAAHIDLVTSTLLNLAAGGVVQLEHREHAAVPASERPSTTPWVRWQVRDDYGHVTNARHQDIRLEDDAARRLLALLDGTRDRDSLAGELEVTHSELDDALRRLADLSLLVA
jgi:SAM-dependent methyltransferase